MGLKLVVALAAVISTLMVLGTIFVARLLLGTSIAASKHAEENWDCSSEEGDGRAPPATSSRSTVSSPRWQIRRT
jgi:hypothetical protein